MKYLLSEDASYIMLLETILFCFLVYSKSKQKKVWKCCVCESQTSLLGDVAVNHFSVVFHLLSFPREK